MAEPGLRIRSRQTPRPENIEARPFGLPRGGDRIAERRQSDNREAAKSLWKSGEHRHAAIVYW